MKRLTDLVTLLLAASSLSTVSASNDTISTSGDTNVHFLSRRRFPVVSGLSSTSNYRGKNGASLVTVLAANGDKWLQELKVTEKNPPEPPNDQAGFLEHYTDTKGPNRVAFEGDEAWIKLGEFDSGFAEALGLTSQYSDTDIIETWSKHEEHGELMPYQIAVSKDGETAVIGHSFTWRDAKSGQFQFEDLFTYFLAYAQQEEKFKEKKADIPAVVRKLKRIGVHAIVNPQTKGVIDEFYKEKGKKLGKAFHDVGTGSKFYKALIASNNGSLGPKFLGTNMKTLKSGSVGRIKVRKVVMDEMGSPMGSDSESDWETGSSHSSNSESDSEAGSSHSFDRESSGSERGSRGGSKGKKRPAGGSESGHKKKLKTGHKSPRSASDGESSLIRRTGGGHASQKATKVSHQSGQKKKSKKSKGKKKPGASKKGDEGKQGQGKKGSGKTAEKSNEENDPVYYMIIELDHKD